ncbi:MAG: class I SAM-dependent methyltransferase [bacterium]|nr:class I SAM-dependent methyltransferase [bacterium]
MTAGLGSGGRQTDLRLGDLAEELLLALEEAGDLWTPECSGDVRLLGTMCARIESRLDIHPNRFSRQKTSMLARILSKHPAITWERFLGGTFVDLGSGGLNPLASMVVLLAAGAGRCYCIDLDELDTEVALRGLARTAMELIAEPATYLPRGLVTGEQVRENLAGLDVLRLERGELAALNGFPLEFRNCSADATGLLTASVDGITSNSFLEHVPDPDAIVAEMARISKSGAIGWHGIDGVDHRSYAQAVGPLDFLRVESSEPLVYQCNRVRPLEFVNRFEEHGFEVLEQEVVRTVGVTNADRARMAEPWRSMPKEHLEVVGLRLSTRRR